MPKSGPDDPLFPLPPGDPEFDPALGMWALSRYADVLAALREPTLWPVPPRKTKNLKVPDETALWALRATVLDAFSPPRLSQWQMRIESAVEELPVAGTIDLVTEFAEPLCLSVAEIVTGSNPADRELLLAEARIVSRAAAEPLDESLRLRATEAGAELNRYFKDSPVPMAGPTFVAMARTTACLLANGWLALLRHPIELARLRVQTEQIPKAVEEILRYGCIPQSVFRHASKPLLLCGLNVAEGGRIILRLASANRDPLHFPDPNRFDALRRGPSHISLGFGLHSCVGGALIRMVAGAATRAFVDRFSAAELCASVKWQGGSGFLSPVNLRVR